MTCMHTSYGDNALEPLGPSCEPSESRWNKAEAETVRWRKPGTHLLQRGTSLE